MKIRARREVEPSRPQTPDAEEAADELRRLDQAYQAARAELEHVKSELAADDGGVDRELDALAASEYVGDSEPGEYAAERAKREQHRAMLRGREEQLERAVEELPELCRACVGVLYDELRAPDRRVVDELSPKATELSTQLRYLQGGIAVAQARIDQLDKDQEEAERPYAPFAVRVAREQVGRSIEATIEWCVRSVRQGLPVVDSMIPAGGHARVAAAKAEYDAMVAAQAKAREEGRLRAFEREDMPQYRGGRINELPPA